VVLLDIGLQMEISWKYEVYEMLIGITILEKSSEKGIGYSTSN